MAITLGELRKVHADFAFMVQLDEGAKPIEVLCDSEEVALVRIQALREADCALKATLRFQSELAADSAID